VVYEREEEGNWEAVGFALFFSKYQKDVKNKNKRESN
jgi:hypothetical protein